MVNERDLNFVDIKSFMISPIKKNHKLKNLYAFDTETESGECFLLGYCGDNDDGILATKDIDKILDFLLTRKFKKAYNFFYNISYDFQAIVKLLPYDNLVELSKYDRTIYKEYKIVSMPNKMFSIERNNKSVKFFDLMQFYNHNSLNNSGIKFLGLKKEELKDDGVDIAALSYERYKTDLEYKFILDKYLRRDCEITYKLGIKLLDMLKPYLKPKYFYSQASISQQYFLENLNYQLKLPNIKILQYGLNSYQGGRFETVKRGYFGKGYIADIKSAYPYHNTQIPHTGKGTWKYTKDDIDDEALIGIYKIDTSIYDSIISPIKYQLKNNLLLYPNGKFKDIFVNKKELEFIRELGYKYKIKSGYEYFDDDPIYPYKFLERFYRLKEKYKSEGQKELSRIPKIIINGFYGKTIQMSPRLKIEKEFKGNDRLFDVIEHDDTVVYVYKLHDSGRLFNPIVANEITANTRTQLLRAGMKRQKNIIGFQTDSIITDKKLDINYGKSLGDWEIENEGEIIILGSGIYQVLNKDGKMAKMRLRGFNKKLDLQNLLRHNLYNDKISITLKRNLKLKKTIKMKNYKGHIVNEKEKMNLFNQILLEDKTININFDKKRIWERGFENCKDVLTNQINSIPVVIKQ